VTFTLDHRLADSSFLIEDWPLCRVCLKNDKSWPWLYLVPRRENIREMFQLSTADQQQLIAEMAMAAQAIDVLYAPDKINTAALGNMVPQLHIHIFGRYKTDPAWPRPVWAIDVPEVPYTDAEKDAEILKLKSYFAEMNKGDKAACQR